MPRPHGTYSIVARDPATGELGVAVQSHWFAVGSLCPWARPGVGAVATQSIVEPAFGPDALDALAAGADARAALEAVLARDELAHVRQLAVVDAGGAVAVHTGEGCIAEAGDVVGAHWSCQANMMATAGVPEAMSAAFAAAEGDLAERLLTALDAAERAGGDVRGRQSAALIVVPSAGEAWRRRCDLRVDDHPAPLDELRRLLLLHRAYALAGEADELAAAADHDAAAARYRRAAELAPDVAELRFWAGLAIAGAGNVGGGAAIIAEVARAHPGWRALLQRLPAELAPSAAAVLADLESS